ncbi:type IV pilus assembly protein PilM [Patescibacteria group bacterium]|nr:type IV pilus assembly protein PilM [Patescibacteria group bacterium]
MKFQSHIGLDIGSQGIKLVQLSVSGPDKFSLSAIGQINTPPVGANQVEANEAKVETIKKLLHDSHAGSRQAVISLPESQVYTRVIEMPRMSEAELAQAIRWQAEQYIPVPLSDVVLKHQLLSGSDESDSPDAKCNVLLIAAPNLLLNSYVSLLSRAGLETVAIETEILAVARALVGADAFSPTSLLVHMGAETTTLSIISRGNLSLTQSISTGGMAISRAVASSLGLEINQAEEYKRSYGMDETKLEGKVVTAIKPMIDLVLAEIKKVLAFYETHGFKDPVKRVVLSGGTALLPGLVGYLSVNLEVEVQVGNPFLSVNLSDKQRQELGENGPLYATAVGLAQKQT